MALRLVKIYFESVIREGIGFGGADGNEMGIEGLRSQLGAVEGYVVCLACFEGGVRVAKIEISER
jgi:hypothetical protein